MKTNKRTYLPEFIKRLLRLVRYRNERKKFIREIGIRRLQNTWLRNSYEADLKKLIVFLIPGSDWETGQDLISGGTISIVSICEETTKLEAVHGAQTIMCTPHNGHLLLKHQKFDNDTKVFRFEQLPKYFKYLTQIMIHVPEFLTEDFQQNLRRTDLSWLRHIPHVHVNIMNQNIQLMPEPSVLSQLGSFAQLLTVTTAHSRYCSQYYRLFYGVPIHKFSVWISPEQYHFVPYGEKENLMVVSPDKHPDKDAVLAILNSVPDLKVRIIQNLTYREYKELVSRAKWTLTFGEGLDGYFIEPVFSGAVAFAIYNEAFFTSDFQELPTVYEGIETLKAQIMLHIAALDHKDEFIKYQEQQYDLCAKYYSKTQYRANIAAFYEGHYTLP